MATNAGGNSFDGFGKNWDDKLRLLDEIDSMREPVRTAAATTSSAVSSDVPSAAVSVSGPAVSSVSAGASASFAFDPAAFEALQEKLRVYEQTCAMLEREVMVLEQQTFASLAEASRLRRELDRSKAERGNAASPEGGDYIAKDQFNRIIKESENERRLLLDALESSEAELARMVKTLDLVVRKLQVA